jgi:hypothetical protein
MSIANLTPHAKTMVIEKLDNANVPSQYKLELMRIKKYILNSKGSDGREFLEKMQRTDAYRKQNFKDTHLEIAKAMGYE